MNDSVDSDIFDNHPYEALLIEIDEGDEEGENDVIDYLPVTRSTIK